VFYQYAVLDEIGRPCGESAPLPVGTQDSIVTRMDSATEFQWCNGDGQRACGTSTSSQ
jgi:hypothetical protein